MSRTTLILTDPDPRSGIEFIRSRRQSPAQDPPLACIVPVERALQAPPSPRLIIRTMLSSVSPDRPAWLPAAASEFQTYVRELDAAAGLPPLAVLPSFDGVISDIPSTLTFLRGRPAWSLVLEPAALLTPEMVDQADDHLQRLADSLAVHPALIGFILPPVPSPLVEGVQRWLLPRLSPRVWIARPFPAIAC